MYYFLRSVNQELLVTDSSAICQRIKSNSRLNLFGSVDKHFCRKYDNQTQPIMVKSKSKY